MTLIADAKAIWIMTNGSTLPAVDGWGKQIRRLQALLKQAKSELVDAEAALAERLAAINAFEFQLRAQLGRIIEKLDALTAEIKAYQRQLHNRSLPQDDLDAAWSAEEIGDVFHNKNRGNYRYRAAPLNAEREKLDEGQTAVLKQLYRQLARRFHPDMGVNAEDRAYRTKMMMAINAAYAAGDLAKMRQLAEEADPLLDDPRNDQEFAETLERELERIQRRLQEIEAEVVQLNRRPSARLMRQVETADKDGRDWLSEIKEELEEQISMKMVERDVLAYEAAQAGAEPTASSEFQSEAFADAILDISLDHTFDASPDFDAAEWAERRQPPQWWDESPS